MSLATCLFERPDSTAGRLTRCTSGNWPRSIIAARPLRRPRTTMPSSHRLRGLLRPTVAFLLYMCAWATFPPAYARQGATADTQSFAAVTRRAIARGRPAEAEALAKQRAAGGPAAGAGLGQLAMGRGQYADTATLTVTATH